MMPHLTSFFLFPTLLLALCGARHPPNAKPYTATLHRLPVSTSTSTPKPLAVLSYYPNSPSQSSLLSFTPPANTTSPDDLTQIAVYLPNNDPKGSDFTSSATATYSFHAPYKGRFRIVVEPETGEIVGASWRAWLPHDADRSTTGKGAGKRSGIEEMPKPASGKGDFDIVTEKKPPPIVFDKPAKGAKGAGAQQAAQAGVEGEGEVEEKTFFQKYWWLLLGVAVLAMTGGGGDK